MVIERRTRNYLSAADAAVNDTDSEDISRQTKLDTAIPSFER